MLPKHTNKVFLTFSPKPGPIAERPIGNQAFMESFLDNGVWLRATAAHCHLKVLQDAVATRLERFGSLAAFYEQIGLSVEDTMTNLVAWSVWSMDKTRNLADLIDRLTLRLGRPNNKDLGASYVNEIRNKLLTTEKHVNVFPREYLSNLLVLYSKTLPQQFGIPWKRYPSVKLVPKYAEEQWAKLPEQLRDGIEALTKPGGEMLAACYNKLKHGPQAVFMSPVAVCVARGYPPELAFDGMRDEPTVRLLLDGARTQDTQEEVVAGRRAAPFVIDDPDNAKRFFFQVVLHNANMLSVVGTWLFNSTFTEAKRDFSSKHDYVNRLLVEQQQHLNNTFPIT